jgi:phage shock protein PspC (stress-responsive transcriptional regulator)
VERRARVYGVGGGVGTAYGLEVTLH